MLGPHNSYWHLTHHRHLSLPESASADPVAAEARLLDKVFAQPASERKLPGSRASCSSHNVRREETKPRPRASSMHQCPLTRSCNGKGMTAALTNHGPVSERRKLRRAQWRQSASARALPQVTTYWHFNLQSKALRSRSESSTAVMEDSLLASLGLFDSRCCAISAQIAAGLYLTKATCIEHERIRIQTYFHVPERGGCQCKDYWLVQDVQLKCKQRRSEGLETSSPYRGSRQQRQQTISGEVFTRQRYASEESRSAMDILLEGQSTRLSRQALTLRISS